jgi:hypothetical protein
MTFNPIGVIGNMSKKAITLLIAFSVVSISALSIGIVNLVRGGDDQIPAATPEQIFTHSGSTITGLTSLGESEQNLVIPANLNGTPITKIGDTAFLSKTNIRTVIIENGIREIGVAAFSNCSNMTSITFPATLTDLYYGASGDTRGPVSYCTSLTSVTFTGQSLTTGLCGNTFRGCTALVEIDLPYGLTTVRYGTFESCTALQRVGLPSTLTTIEGNTFYGCSNLRSLTIPSSVTDFGGGSNYNAFTTIYTDRASAPSGWTSVGTRPIFWGCQLGNSDGYPYVMSFTKSSTNPANPTATNGIQNPYLPHGEFFGWTSDANGQTYTSANLNTAPNGVVRAEWGAIVPPYGNQNETPIPPAFTETTPLYSSTAHGGAENYAVKHYLLDLANLCEPTAAVMTVRDETFKFATARDIATANGTVNAPIVKLFDTITSSTANANKLSEQTYRVVAITYPENGDPVFTFYATGAYRNGYWDNTSPYNQNYNIDSEIPANLKTDFETNMLSAYPAYVKDAIQTPQIWQTSTIATGAPQPNAPSMYSSSYNALNQNLTSERQGDLMWLPSEHEIGNKSGTAGITPGIWGLNTTENSYATNGFSTYSWLRSGSSYNSSGACIVASAGGFGGSNVYYSGALRPALHLTVGNLAQGAKITAGYNNNGGAPVAARVSAPANGGATGKQTTVYADGGAAQVVYDAGAGNGITVIRVGGANVSSFAGSSGAAVAQNLNGVNSADGTFKVWSPDGGQTVTVDISGMTDGMGTVQNPFQIMAPRWRALETKWRRAILYMWGIPLRG